MGIALDIALNAASLVLGRVIEARQTKAAHVYTQDITPEVNSISIPDALTLILQIGSAVLAAVQVSAAQIDPKTLYITRTSDDILGEIEG